MNVAFETYWPLAIAALLPLLWWAGKSTKVDFTRRHLVLSTAVRSLILILLALALAQPVLRKPSTDVSVVYALDVSHSIAPGAIQEALKWIDKTNQEVRPEHSRFVAFGGNAQSFETLDALRNVQVVSGAKTVGAVDQGGTDLAAALDVATRSLAPDHLHRVVLLSDGNATSGDMTSEMLRLRLEGARVYTVPLNVRANRDVWVEGVKAPATVTAEEQFPLEAHVYSQSTMEANVEIREGSKVLGKRAVHLTPGLNRIAFETRVSESKGTATVIAAAVMPTEDTFAGNNTVRENLIVTPQPRVLYVEGRAASAHYLAEALGVEGFRIDTVGPQSVPAAARDLALYDAVILSDVDGKLLRPEQMRAMAAYVRDLGGGLVMAGGENIYGQGGYTKTTLEEALPVTFDVSRKKPPTVAMVVVMDNSGSMSGLKIDLAKQAARAPLELLRDTDHYGIVTFNTNANWVWRLSAVTDRPSIASAVSSVGVGGGTDAYNAMNEAMQALNAQSDEIKTILFLTDGQTQVRDYKTLTSRMLKDGIRVTTVAIGRGADRELLADIAMWGKGRAYYVEAANNIPQIFVRETELAMDKALHETPFNLLVEKSVDAFKGIDFKAAPNLLGYVATRPKPTAEILLKESVAGDPVLARWQYGLGKTAMFASDLKDRWAVNWLQWGGYKKFWSQLVRETMRRNTQDFDFRVKRAGQSAQVRVDAVDKDGRFQNGLDLKARFTGSGGGMSLVSLPQVGPGSYVAETKVAANREYAVGVGRGGGEGVPQAITYSYPDEYHFYPTDTAVLKSISRETGGAFEPSAADLVKANGETVEVKVPLRPWLAALGLMFFVLDVLLRRLRLFEAA